MRTSCRGMGEIERLTRLDRSCYDVVRARRKFAELAGTKRNQVECRILVVVPIPVPVVAPGVYVVFLKIRAYDDYVHIARRRRVATSIRPKYDYGGRIDSVLMTDADNLLSNFFGRGKSLPRIIWTAVHIGTHLKYCWSAQFFSSSVARIASFGDVFRA